MITGIVNQNGEAILRIVIGQSKPQQLVIDALIDTGYTGFLTLPPTTIRALDLRWLGSEEGVLGDGSTQLFDVYTTTVIWDGEYQTIKVNESSTVPLIGVGLLYGYEVCIQTINRGNVTVKRLPQ